MDGLTLSLDEKIALSYNVLAKLFHGVELFGALSPHHVDFTERSSSDDFDQLEVIETDFLVWS